VSYWDTSALVKRCAPKPDSTIFDHYVQNSTDPAVTARIASWEARATFRRKEMEGVIQPGGTQMLHAELLADITAVAIAIAADVAIHSKAILKQKAPARPCGQT